MKQISLLIIIVFSLFSCSEYKETASEQYTLIGDNLYSDKSGNLYLKAIDRSLAEGGTAKENKKLNTDRWLNVVYCDTCKLMFTDENTKQLGNSQPDRMTELQNVIDTATFRLVEIGTKKNVTIYEDKNYIYYHQVMLDGGTISLGEKANPTEALAMNNNLIDSSFLNPTYFKKLQKYIRKNGIIEKVNASGYIDKPIYITYHILVVDKIKLTMNNSNRIYFSSEKRLKLGNILLSDDGKNLSFEDCNKNNRQLIYSTYLEALKLTK